MTKNLYVVESSDVSVAREVVKYLQGKGYETVDIMIADEQKPESFYKSVEYDKCFNPDEILSVYRIDGFIHAIASDHVDKSSIVLAEDQTVYEEIILKYNRRNVIVIDVEGFGEHQPLGADVCIVGDDIYQVCEYVLRYIQNAEKFNVFPDKESTDTSVADFIQGLDNLEARDTETWTPVQSLFQSYWNSYDTGISKLQVLSSFLNNQFKPIARVDTETYYTENIVKYSTALLNCDGDLLDSEKAYGLFRILLNCFDYLTELGYDFNSKVNSTISEFNVK